MSPANSHSNNAPADNPSPPGPVMPATNTGVKTNP